MSGDHNMNQKKPTIKIDGVEINQTTPYIDYDAWIASPLTKALKDKLEAAVEAERQKVAIWMIEHSYATGHGDTTEDLLKELEWQIRESEREACAKVCADGIKAPNYPMLSEIAAAIRARGETK